MNTQKFIARKSLLVAVIFGLSSILGLFRESSIAYMFGATGKTDAYFVAMTIPSLFIGVISGSITSTFITVYTGYMAKGETEQAWRTTNIILSLFTFILGTLCICLNLLAAHTVRVVAPNYIGEQLRLTVNIVHILLPNVFFGGMLGILVGINNSNNSFIAPASIGLILNIMVISGTYTLGRIWGIYGLAVSTSLGILGQFLLQVPSAKKHGLKYRFMLDIKDPGVREMIKLVLPFIFTAAINQIDLIIDRSFATQFTKGTVTSLYLAGKLVLLPQTIFSSAVGMVILPLLVRAASLMEWDKLVEVLFRGIRLISFFLIPAAAVFIVLKVPIVQLLFQHGSFTKEDTMMTASLMPYILGMMYFGAVNSLLSNIYFATKKVKYIVMTGAAAVTVKVMASFLLIKTMHQWGLVLADSTAAFAAVILMAAGIFKALKLHKKTKIPVKPLLHFFIKVTTAAIFMGCCTIWADILLSGTFVAKHGTLLRASCDLLLGIMSYLAAAYVLRVEEAVEGVSWILMKMGRRLN